MDLQKSFRQAIDIVQLKEATLQEVANDPKAMPFAWAMVVLGALATGLGVTLFPVQMGLITYRPDLMWILQQTLLQSIGMLFGLYVGGYAAEKWFDSKLSMYGFVRVMGHAAVLGLVAIIPFLNIICLWELVVMWHLCTKIGKMKAESTVLFLVLLFVFSSLLTTLS